ncbi:FAD-dependent oxidoreductase [Luteibacter yeojuensis]|uniref:Alkyl hydroperoxide reductase subunit F n=1 Tax=Luteibacter yeojuensis TaxID=345309 RepID=A0A0F3KBF7_9GAMM|nr:FAD-dependent oxidoreductase [Luteibacter yeojuensis]KJV27439.1 2-polyprenyl-6-methoxyphenol hydroxylase [Luteibacter yeojuensis]
MTSSRVDVLICGAGAAGLTLAIELARRGVAFRLIEKAPVPFVGSRGKGIQPRTLEIFEDMGVLDRMMATGSPYPVVRTHAADGSWSDAPVTEAATPSPAEPYVTPLMLPQFLTEGILRDRLVELGGRVDFGCELLGFEQGDEAITVRVAGPASEETVIVRYLVAADGGRSSIRRALGIGFPGKELGTRAIVADVTLHGLDREAWHRFSDGDMSRQLAVCPLAGTALFQIQAPVPLDSEPDLSVEGLQAFVRDRSGRADITVTAVAWASAYTMSARLADTYRVGDVFLIGDAAHVHPPTGGQGLNTSTQDAYNLGWKLAAVLRGARASLLDTYEEERRPIAAGMLGLSTRMLDALKQGSMRRAREVNQLDLGYAGSSLSLEAPARGDAVLRAGDRAPDAPLRGASGQRVRVFDLLRGPHWTLIGMDVDRTAVAPSAGVDVHVIGNGRELCDEHGHFAAAYGIDAGSWTLVRPDGYVAAIVDGSGTDSLNMYLASHLRPLAGSPGDHG